MFELKKIRKSYVDFTTEVWTTFFSERKSLAILGASGSGKTTV